MVYEKCHKADKGLNLISRHIGNLPEHVVEALIQEYALYDILNNKVSRHQICTIIEHSVFGKSKKIKSKFRYLDSLMLANLINSFLVEQMEEVEEEKNLQFPSRLVIN